MQCGFDLLLSFSNTEKCTLVNWGVFMALSIPRIVCFFTYKTDVAKVGGKRLLELRLSFRLLWDNNLVTFIININIYIAVSHLGLFYSSIEICNSHIFIIGFII